VDLISVCYSFTHSTLHKRYRFGTGFFIIPVLEYGRGETMPDVTQAEIGRRMYHVHREKRVEQTIKLMQQGIGPDWRSLSEDEIHLLSHLLQCTWNRIDQKEWDKIPFGKVRMDMIRKILSYSEGIGPGHNPPPEAVAEIKKLLLALG
jgi:hypothetical protein